MSNEAVYNLNGTWIPVQQEIGGKFLKAETFMAQQLILKDSIYTYRAESIDKGILTYRNGRMDIFGKTGVNSGNHIKAIYKFESNQLVICYNLKGDDYPSDFITKSNSFYFLSFFKKQN